jgi:hypothetical protein
LKVTMSSEPAATAVARTWRSFGSFVIAGSSRSISAASTSASSNPRPSLHDPAGLLLGDLAFREVAAHLIEDALAPERRVQPELSESEQGVAEREG